MKTLNDIKASYERSQATLLQDAMGAAALGVMLMVALHLPSII